MSNSESIHDIGTVAGLEQAITAAALAGEPPPAVLQGAVHGDLWTFLTSFANSPLFAAVVGAIIAAIAKATHATPPASKS